MPPPNQGLGYLRLASLSFIGTLFALRLALVSEHAFNPDEFQHLHGAWSIAHGLLPYRDYFEHHTPWLAFFLAPFLSLFPVDTNPDAAQAFIFFARVCMVAFSAMAMVLTYRLGRLSRGEAAAWPGTALLAAMVMFLDLTLEVRPDVPAVTFLLGSWVAWLLAYRSNAERGEGRGWAFKSGLLMGAAILCTQKALFTLPATALLWVLSPGEGGPAGRRRAALFLSQACGLALPIAAVLMIFALQGGLAAFVDFNLVVNLNWPARFSPGPLLRQVFRENSLVVVLGLAGMVSGVRGLVRPGGRRLEEALVPVQALGLTAGVFVVPIPYAQYLLPVLPLISLLAAGVMVDLSTAIQGRRSAFQRAAASALASLILVGSLVPPFRIMALMLVPGHTKVDDSLRRLRFVILNTRPTDRFLDGFSGLGVFRPHAYFYFFLHDEIRLLLQGQGFARLFAELRDGAVAPDWVIMDDDLRALEPRIVTFVGANYEPAEVAPLWRLKGPWLDEGGWRELGGGESGRLAGRGWSGAEQEGGRSFRKGSARHSSIRLPVRDPRGCRELLLRVRAGNPASESLFVRILLNRVSIGVTALQKDWEERALPLPPGLLGPGVNELELTADGELPGTRPGPSGRSADSLLAVEAFRLECGRAKAGSP